MAFIFVDVEAEWGSPCPGVGNGMTEFGAVEFETKETFHGKPNKKGDWHEEFILFKSWLIGFKGRPMFVSDNPAFDWQWINYHFWHELGENPFGHSARRIGDFYAGLINNWHDTQKWKSLRITYHDHNPVNDAMGNVEAVKRLLSGERP